MNKVKPTFPNNWDLVEMFLKNKEYENIQYCINTKRFYLYKNNYWNTLPSETLHKYLIKFIKEKYPKTYKQFNLRSLPEIETLLKFEGNKGEFSMIESTIRTHKKGYLLPFKNGILNTLTLKLLPHSSDYYLTYILPYNYDNHKNIIDTPMARFLIEISNFNTDRLIIIRVVLYLILTNNLDFQKALYIYGQGGTGKSTFTNLLVLLLGPDACVSTTLNQLNSRFGLAPLYGKILILLNDISLYKGREPKIIKEIISRDLLQAEQKYENPFFFNPKAFIIFSSNVIWEIKEATTGLSRRLIYLPFDHSPPADLVKTDLFKIGEDPISPSGQLVKYIPGLINWILSCPKKYIDIFKGDANKINETLSQDSIYFNPLHVWVDEYLLADVNSNIQIGNHKSNKDTLYGNYLNWCKIQGSEPIKFTQFSSLLIDNLKQKGWNVYKKRISTGYILQGVLLKERPSIQNNLNIQISRDLSLSRDYSPLLKEFK